MIPLLFLALGLGIALTAYEFSPRAHQWGESIRSAIASHQTADAYLQAGSDAAAAHQQALQQVSAQQQAANETAQQPTIPRSRADQEKAKAVAQMYGAAKSIASTAEDFFTTAVQHLNDAAAANRSAAADTAAAAQTAKTDQQKSVAADSAAVVDDRREKIKAALASLGVGQCDVHTYPRMTEGTKNALLDKLHGAGMTVTGDNPWSIDTHEHDVKLRAVWDPQAQILRLIVTSSAWYVPCAKIWEKIDPILKVITT